MRRIHTVIIGGGQAGLAMSRCLTDRSVDHVVLERGRVGESWRSERWDSLRLLTPSWQSRLPGYRYQGSDPDGFMTMPDVIGYLEGYARSFAAPVEDRTSVSSVTRDPAGFRIATDRGVWNATNVVVATGYCGLPDVPAIADQLPRGILQISPTRYRNPEQLPPGGVLVVGASASGLQLADEIHRSGRPVTLAVGRHTRLPRSWRGRDIMWWLDVMGVMDERVEEVGSVAASRRQPSLQLVGSPERRSLDLATVAEAGVRLTGRALGVEDGSVCFGTDLDATAAAADAKLARLLERIDGWAEAHGIAGGLPTAEPVAPFRPTPGPSRIDLAAEGIRTVVWATGFRRSYPWLQVDVLDDRGEIRQSGGVTPVPGLYALGLSFMRRRKSTYIDGVGADAAELAAHIAAPRAIAA